MEIQRILAADTKTATDKAIAQFGPDVLIISNNRVNGQTELLVAADITLEDERAAEPLAASKPSGARSPTPPRRQHPSTNGTGDELIRSGV